MHSRIPGELRPEEQHRFSAMNDMLNPTSVGMLGLRGGERILDVGCGLGQLTRAMARASGRGAGNLGIVHSQSWLEEAKRLAESAGETSLVEFRAGDLTRLPLAEDEWGAFDLVHARFVLEQVLRPKEVVEAMVRAARSGGRIVLEDDDQAMIHIWPEPRGYKRLREGYVRWIEAQGYDPFVGRRLVSLLQEAGSRPMRSASLSVSACAGSPSFRPLLGIVEAAFRSIGTSMLAGGVIQKDEYEAGMSGLRVWKDLPDAALWYTTCWAEGRRTSG